jgi:hypothetical protein
MTKDYAEQRASVLKNLDGLQYDVERKQVVKHNEARVFTHIHVYARFNFELTVYAEDKAHYVFKSSITGKAIERASIAELEALLVERITPILERELDILYDADRRITRTTHAKSLQRKRPDAVHFWKKLSPVWLKHRWLTSAHASTVTPGMETSILTIIPSEQDCLLRQEAVVTLSSSPLFWEASLLMWWSGSPTRMPVALLGANGEPDLRRNKHGSDKTLQNNFCSRGIAGLSFDAPC